MRIKQVAIISLIMLLFIPELNASSASYQTNVNQGQESVPHVQKINPQQRSLNAQKIKNDVSQLREHSFRLINQERYEHGIPLLKSNQKLNRLATLRSQQIEHHFSHYDHHGNTMTYDDAHRVKLPHDFSASENIASAGLGNCMLLGDAKTYHNHNGDDMADMDEDAMMNHDQLENNGHRKNILSQASTLIGVGAAYSPQKHKFYLAEDFGDHDADSSQDVESTSTAEKYQKAEHLVLQREWHQAKRTVAQWFSYVYKKMGSLYKLLVRMLQ